MQCIKAAGEEFLAKIQQSLLKVHVCMYVSDKQICGDCKASETSKPFLPAGARAVRERLVLRMFYVFHVCLFVCLFVRPHLSGAQYITSYVTMRLLYRAAFGGL